MLGKGKAKSLVPAQGQSCLYAASSRRDFTFSDKLVLPHHREDWSENRDKWIHEGQDSQFCVPLTIYLTRFPMSELGRPHCFSSPFPAFEYFLPVVFHEPRFLGPPGSSLL